MRRVLLLSLILLLGGTRAAANQWPLLAGGFSGDFRVRTFSAAPPIQWRVEALTKGATENRFTIRAHARGLTVRAIVILPRDGSPGTWRLVEGQLDLSEWWAILIDSGFMSEMPADLRLTGELQFAGSGEMEGTQITGGLTAKLVGGSLSSADQEWSVRSMDFEAALNLSEENPMIESLSLTAPEVEVQGFLFEELNVTAVGQGLHHLNVQMATVSLFGGRVGLRPFVFDWKQPEILAIAELDGVALSELVSLVPDALSAAQGRLSGALEIGWSAELGVQPGTGSLRITQDTSTTLRMAATPNFLTQHVSPKIEWVPAMFGPIGKWLATDNPAYETLRQIEMGEMALSVEAMEVALYPNGPEGLVSARVAVTARPSESSAVEEVSFEVNVTGPLKEVLLLGTDDRVSIGVKSK